MMHAHDLRLNDFDEWRESLHVPVRWRREAERQSCLEEKYGQSETEA